MRHAFPCTLWLDADDLFKVSFQDFPEFGETATDTGNVTDAFKVATHVLVMVLKKYIEMGRDIPLASPMLDDQYLIVLPNDIEHQLMFYKKIRD